MLRRWFAWFTAGVVLSAILGCGDGTSSTAVATKTGSVSVSLTDAPAFGFEHVWITVKDIWFHTSDGAEAGETGWLKYPLASPVTVDLLTLNNGTVSAPVWSGISLPVGSYQQIRLVLAGTEDALTSSASAIGLAYNNEVDIQPPGALKRLPLRIPDARHGIRLVGAFQVAEASALNLAIDFDAGHDVVEVQRNGKTEYILKPRLEYFDLDNAGAVVGHIDPAAAGSSSTAHFVFKAEQVGPDGNYHVVRRATALAGADGRYVLYPLKPGSYDLILRGINYETVIVKGVPVAKGSTPGSGATIVPTITMTAATVQDYPASASITAPTGAWTNFYQTLPGEGEVPYEIRFRHFNPFTGAFASFLLSSGRLHAGNYDPLTITLAPVTPVEGNGGFKAVAGALLYERSAPVTVSQAGSAVSFGTLSVKSPAISSSVSGTVFMPEAFQPNTMDKGIVFAVRGGMIVNTMNVDTVMQAGGGPYSMPNLPGGFPMAFYGVEALAWSSADPSIKAASLPAPADLRAGDATGVDFIMHMLP